MALTQFYEDQVLPRLIHFMTDMKEMRKHRERALLPARGVVLEIGMGSGHTLRYYPEAVTKVLAVEPSLTARSLASKAIAKSRIPVEWVGLDGEKIDLPDGSADTAVSCLTLCTIPRAQAALKDIFRVLKPGGGFIFMEHGASPDERILRWQNRLNGIQGKLFGGCNLNRPISELIQEAGFKLDSLENFYVKGPPRPMGYTYLGLARKA